MISSTDLFAVNISTNTEIIVSFPTEDENKVTTTTAPKKEEKQNKHVTG